MTSIAFIHKAGGSVVVFVGGKPHTVEPTAINYKLVVQAIESSDYDSLVDLLNIRKTIADYTNGRVEVFGKDLYFDKKIVTGKLSERILSMLAQDMLVEPYVRFMEKVQSNPLESAREELFTFMELNNLPITPDGDFLAYKYIRSDWLDCYSKSFDNSIGASPRMDRAMVCDDRNVACAPGLHVCSYNYVRGVGGDSTRLVVVKVNPFNVVSIPIDHNNEKMRVCEYVVVDEITDWADSIPRNYTETYVAYDDESAYDYEEEEEWVEEEEEFDYTDEDDVNDMIRELKGDKKLDPLVEAVKETMTVDFSTKLTIEDVRDIRKLLADNWSLAGIARDKKISARQVARIRDGESWADVV